MKFHKFLTYLREIYIYESNKLFFFQLFQPGIFFLFASLSQFTYVEIS